MRKPRLIFLSGYKGSGKDTFAKLLADEYKKSGNNNFVVVALADALKREVYSRHGVEFTTSLEEDRDFKESVREELIQYAESEKRKNGEYYWIAKAIFPIIDPIIEAGHIDKLPDIIVTDCRRVEEVMWYKHIKFGTLNNEISKYYDTMFFIVHREDAEVTDNDYLTRIALKYAVESRIMDKLIRNYRDITKLEVIAKEVYAVKLK